MGNTVSKVNVSTTKRFGQAVLMFNKRLIETDLFALAQSTGKLTQPLLKPALRRSEFRHRPRVAPGRRKTDGLS